MHWDGSEHEFRSPFDFHVRTPLTLVELRMRRYSGKIRQKPRWWEKVLDGALVQKWREEMAAHDRGMVDELWGGQERYDHGDGRKKWPRDPITEVQMDFIFEELRYEAGRMDAETGIYVSDDHLIKVTIAMHVLAERHCWKKQKKFATWKQNELIAQSL